MSIARSRSGATLSRRARVTFCFCWVSGPPSSRVRLLRAPLGRPGPGLREWVAATSSLPLAGEPAPAVPDHVTVARVDLHEVRPPCESVTGDQRRPRPTEGIQDGLLAPAGVPQARLDESDGLHGRVLPRRLRPRHLEH